MTDTELHKARFLEVIRSIEEHAEGGFDMNRFVHDRSSLCSGSPSCVLGHYVAYGKQNTFAFHPRYPSSCLTFKATGDDMSFDHPSILDHFGITLSGAEMLFGPNGCDDAVSAEQAVTYLKVYVEKRFGDLNP